MWAELWKPTNPILCCVTRPRHYTTPLHYFLFFSFSFCFLWAQAKQTKPTTNKEIRETHHKQILLTLQSSKHRKKRSLNRRHGCSTVLGDTAQRASGTGRVVQLTCRSVPEEALAPTHSQTWTVCRSRRLSGLFLYVFFLSAPLLFNSLFCTCHCLLVCLWMLVFFLFVDLLGYCFWKLCLRFREFWGFKVLWYN